ncbi:ABC transporter substrate-binding protein [Clostridium beijerinckii]|jgi:carbohydrate ABC transporter substrate-binding protein, CUT1 family (TC 3.A.1.1.-)|uniref:Carbohydrate ABC transporter substrate-binding protein n=2 Tax=Clostridium beijerinckii TaxID=1520 RepID=A0AAE2RPF3_CLOBE|nr:ABC transporter substrate-binding protein [Clostridium beijerinckii]ABR32569.1 ABC-type sugar transport system periplasmic component-like protein [Clostridium beijerinckii NCIMB 8052]AIU01159.1 ABC-type sugar transport system periplasmic component-like protein [Clostridium beijerinckii ATCC 35702]MBF7807751.1 carbohydrate ABC transporter substrate-binding protein [Clostridium beijerinckii]NOW88367.1 multiple sugar transport system substrate-binding protein [Clostridium beijerinckii]NRT26200
MKNKIKYAIVFSILLLIGIVSINLFQPNKEQQVRGNIELLVNENSYEYLVECANNFMKENDRTSISVKKLENYNHIINNNSDGSTKSKISSIAQIDRFSFDKLKLDNYEYYNKDDKLLSEYAKNFSKYRVAQVKYGDNSIGIPLTSRPLAFYVREDLLKSYGYERDSLNTWDDIIRIGKDIHEKSNGKIFIINATDQDYEDLMDLLTMETLSDGDKSIDAVKSEVQAMMKKLEDNNILNLQSGGEFLARISSINAMKEIAALDVPCTWSVNNVPSLKPGANKFFSSEGDNLLILNQNSENDKLIEKFITYVITNNKEAVKYVKEGKFFSSYLYTYNTKDIEEPVKNFTGKSPLVVLSNIEEKTPIISNYDEYIKIKQEIRANTN